MAFVSEVFSTSQPRAVAEKQDLRVKLRILHPIKEMFETKEEY